MSTNHNLVLKEVNFNKNGKDKKISKKKWLLIVVLLIILLLSFTLTYYLISSNVVVVFHANGGTFERTENLKIKTKTNKLITEPTNPTYSGYSLVGWSTDIESDELWDFENDKIKKNTNLYAKWEIENVDNDDPDINNPDTDKPITPPTIMCNVSLVLNGGKIDNTSFETEVNSLINRPSTPTYFGHTFIGWYKDEALENEWDFDFDKPTTDLTLYAKWDADYYFTEENGLLTITKAKYPLADRTLPTELLQKEVVGINANAFYNDLDLTRIVVPNTITFIGDNAFSSCPNLKEAILSSIKTMGTTLFAGCENLESVTIPFVGGTIQASATQKFDYFFGENSVPNTIKNVTICSGDIANGAFHQLASIESVVLLDGVTSIGASAFGAIDGLTSITLSENITTIGNGAFYNCINLKELSIPTSVTKINPSITSNCINLETFSTGNGITEIPNGQFFGCFGLKNIIIGTSVTAINAGAFQDTAIEEIVIPDNVTTIMQGAFSNCKNLESIDFGNGVTELQMQILHGCENLKNVTIGNGVQKIQNSVFSNTAIEEIVIPDNVTFLGNGAFNNCINLEAAIIGEGVTELTSGIFDGCINLKSVTTSKNITRIGNAVFDKCASLEQFIIPSSVVEIWTDAFQNCSATIFVEATEKPSSWHTNWNRSHTGQVYFGNEWEYVNGVPTIK